MRYLVLSALILALAGTMTSAANWVYDSNGFEPPTFAPGPLNGQDSWVGSSSGGGVQPMVVTPPDPVVGTQSVRMEVGTTQGDVSQADYATPGFWVAGNPNIQVKVSFDIYRNQKPNQNLWWWWSDAGDPTYGLQWDIGGTRPFGFGGAEAATVAGQWTNITMVWDFSTGLANSWYNGNPVDVNYPIAGTNSVSTWTFYFGHDSDTGTAADVLWIDNFRIEASGVPEPGSLMALGSGLLGVLGFAFRRRR